MSNELYLEEICKQLARIPADIAKTVSAEIFEQVVQKTRVDSGQAAANWHFEPYKGTPFTEPEEIMWGYANQDPIAPVGYKWAMYDNSEAVYRWQFENLADRLSMTQDDIDGILIYNPVTAGFAGFHPGTDVFYPDNAFAALNVEGIVNAALERTYAEYNNAHA